MDEGRIITISGADYRVFRDGSVFSCKTGVKIKQRPNEDGYASFTAGIKGNRTRVRTHRVVAELFVDNPHNYDEVDHLDSDRMNPPASNLEWVTHNENIRRAYARGNHMDAHKINLRPKQVVKRLVFLCPLSGKGGSGCQMAAVHGQKSLKAAWKGCIKNNYLRKGEYHYEEQSQSGKQKQQGWRRGKNLFHGGICGNREEFCGRLSWGRVQCFGSDCQEK